MCCQCARCCTLVTARSAAASRKRSNECASRSQSPCRVPRREGVALEGVWRAGGGQGGQLKGRVVAQSRPCPCTGPAAAAQGGGAAARAVAMGTPGDRNAIQNASSPILDVSVPGRNRILGHLDVSMPQRCRLRLRRLGRAQTDSGTPLKGLDSAYKDSTVSAVTYIGFTWLMTRSNAES